MDWLVFINENVCFQVGREENDFDEYNDAQKYQRPFKMVDGYSLFKTFSFSRQG